MQRIPEKHPMPEGVGTDNTLIYEKGTGELYMMEGCKRRYFKHWPDVECMFGQNPPRQELPGADLQRIPEGDFIPERSTSYAIL